MVLRFDDEHAEPGDEDVVYLGRTVLQPQRDMIHQVIGRGTEVRRHGARYERLTNGLE